MKFPNWTFKNLTSVRLLFEITKRDCAFAWD